MSIGYINVGSSSVNQDNKDIAKYVTLNKFGLTPLPNRILTFLNNNDPITVTDTQNLWIFVSVVYDNNKIAEIQKIKVFNKGKGTYGLGNTQFSLSDLEVISTQSLTLGAIESNPLTQVVIIADLDGLNVSDYFNQMEALELQDISTAPRLIKTPTADYLFLAVGGIYGLDNLQTTTSDFQLLDAEVSNATKIKYITDASQICNKELLSDYVYQIENQLTLTEPIIVPATGLTLVGYGFNVSSLFSSVPGFKMFTSPVGGSGDLILDKFSITNVGIGSEVFDIVDSTGQHAIEIEFVNFNGCKSLGKIDGYRQGTVTTAGLYGCADGLKLSGSWNGFKVSNTNLFGFGNTGTFIKKDDNTTFANRLFLTSSNFNFPIGAKLSDFISDNLLDNELFQINSCTIKVNNEIDVDLATDLVPNLSANDLKCLWTANNGFPNSATENFVEDTEISVLFDIDWLKQTYLLTMTGDTEFTESNLPASGKNTQEIKIYLEGDFIPTFPADWLVNAVGTYKGSDLNEITLKFLKTGVYFMKIDNSLSVYPKPSLQSLSPTSLLPSTTASLTINGSFFTPETIVKIQNQTVNSVEFINQGQLILSVTTSEVEEEVDITISNGTTVVFSGVLPINLGVVFIPQEIEWISLTNNPNVTQNGFFIPTILNANTTGVWDKEIDKTKNYIIEWFFQYSELAPTGAGSNCQLQLVDIITNLRKLEFWDFGGSLYAYKDDNTIVGGTSQIRRDMKFKLLKIGNTLNFTYWKLDTPNAINGYSTSDYATEFPNNLKLRIFSNFNIKISNIKYIELP